MKYDRPRVPLLTFLPWCPVVLCDRVCRLADRPDTEPDTGIAAVRI